MSNGLFNTRSPALYCVNASGGNNTFCGENDTLVANNSFVCTTTNGLCAGGSGGGWTASNTSTNTSLIVNVNGLYLCNNGTTGIITVNQSYAEANC